MQITYISLLLQTYTFWKLKIWSKIIFLVREIVRLTFQSDVALIGRRRVIWSACIIVTVYLIGTIVTYEYAIYCHSTFDFCYTCLLLLVYDDLFCDLWLRKKIFKFNVLLIFWLLPHFSSLFCNQVIELKSVRKLQWKMIKFYLYWKININQSILIDKASLVSATKSLALELAVMDLNPLVWNVFFSKWIRSLRILTHITNWCCIFMSQYINSKNWHSY